MFLKKTMPIIKLIFKTILILLLLIVILEIAIFEIEKKKYVDRARKLNEFYDANNAKYSFKTDDFNINMNMRPTANFGTKHTILVFGCSYAYGANLENEEILSYQLAKKTQSTVYNKAYLGWGAPQILYQLRLNDFYKTITPPDYIIYVFIEDHLNRLDQYQWGGSFWNNTVNLRYKEKNGKLEEIKPVGKFFWHFFIVKEIQEFLVKYNNNHNKKQNIRLFTKIMEESLTLTKQHYPNSKFVILEYSPDASDDPKVKEMLKVLENKGFIVIKTDDILKDDLRKESYRLADLHPSAKAWEDLSQALIKKLNL